jgi:hypothetical protein
MFQNIIDTLATTAAKIETLANPDVHETNYIKNFCIIEVFIYNPFMLLYLTPHVFFEEFHPDYMVSE